MRQTWQRVLILAAVFLLLCLGVWKPELGAILLALVICVLLWYVIYVILTYRINIRKGSLAETDFSLKNGILRFSREQKDTACPASQVVRVIQRKELLFIVMKEFMGQERYFIVPDRAFLGQEEKHSFLKELARASVCPSEQEGQSRDEPLYRFSFFADREFLVKSLTLTKQEDLDSQKHYRLRILLYILIILAGVGLLLKDLFKDRISDPVFWGLMALCCLAGLLAGRKKSVQRRLARQLEKMASKGKLLELLGNWQVDFYESFVLVSFNGLENHADHASFQRLLDSPDMYIFYGGRYGYSFALPKQAVPAEQREDFLAFCGERIARFRQTDRTRKKRKMSRASRILLTAILVLVLGAAAALAVLVLEERDKKQNHTREDNIPEYDADFKFQPADYPDYLPIEEQIEVLKELGFEVPEGAADYYHGWMDSSEYGKLYVEGYPFYILLSDLGTPNYDMDTYQFLGYSEQVYWFAYESWDISQDYMEILEGVQALTGGEVDFIGASEDCEDVNWRRGTGTIRVTFWCCGHPYEFKANVDGDWLDKDFIAFLNEVLDEEGFEKQLYASTDNDDGCILFYQDETWAEKFTERTGLDLSETAK